MDQKAAKEAFVTGHSGTTMTELILVSLPAPVGLWLLGEARALVDVLRPGRRTSLGSPVSASLHFAAEFAVLVLPILVSLTWTQFTASVLVAMACSAALCAVAARLLRFDALPSKAGAPGAPKDTRAAMRKRWARKKADALSGDRRSFVDDYRCGVMLITCLSILAVDFNVFPRRFAKTEVDGTGLMDLGTGAIMFVSGIVAARPKRRQTAEPEQDSEFPFLRALLASWPLVVLALGRLVAVKLVGYQEHISEYGAHWNFFATILCVRLAAAAAKAAAAAARLPATAAAATTTAAAFVLMLVYQAALSLTALRSWLLDDGPRHGFVSQNREGLLGVIGYLFVRMAAEQLARLTIWRPAPPKVAMALMNSRLVLLRLGAASALLWTAALAASHFLRPPSRRGTDLTYTLWCLAHNSLLLLLVAAATALATRPPACELGARVSRAMFPVFAVANLATGAVNLTINTIETSDAAARTLLMAYMAAVCGAAWWLGQPPRRKRDLDRPKLD